MKKEILTGKDLQQITAVGIGKEQILDQLAKFKKGAAPVHLTKPAVIGDGILRFSAKKEQELVSLFTTKAYARKIIKFVPASGAASRMFNALQNYRCAPAEEDKNNSEAVFIQDFIAAIEKKKFAFHEDLQAALKRGGFHIEDLLSRQDYHTIIKYLLDPRGLDYANLPKALLKPYPGDGGGTEGFVPDIEAMLEAYYSFRGWDPVLGFPTAQKLSDLKLDFVIRDLWPETQAEGVRS